jgi:trk system potassium uptake protein TrkH
MNLRMTKYIIGRMLGVEALVLLIPAFVGFLYQEEVAAFLFTSMILGTVYALCGLRKPDNTIIYGKEGFVIIASAWILWSLFGALPFFLSGAIPSYIDAFFETVSGFTTTGSTILTDIASLPKGMNFWRCLTHWIGGMGVLVFVMVIVSLEEKNSMHLMRAEVPGPETDKLVPKARQSAKILYGMYFGLTVLQVILLLFGGMDLYDSIIHAFSTAGTGGFNNRNNSVAYYDSAYIDGVITTFMILFGINFNMYYLLLLKKVKAVLKNEEVRVYLGIIAATTLLITTNILSIYEAPLKAFRYAVFQVASVITTTGFATADYNLWPEFSKTLLLMLMVVGACAGSTGGGMKVSRIIIMAKSVWKEMHRMLKPKSVSIVKVNGKKIEEDTMNGVFVYVVAYVIFLVVSVLLISLNNFDFATTFSSVLTTMNNIGPGIAAVGPVENFSAFSDFSKIIFCLNMLVGRLEIFPFLVLFSPDLWRRKF